MENQKHKYSSYLLLVFGILLFISMIGAFDTGDMELLCNQETSVMRRLNGVWGCSLTHFAEGHFQNYSTPITITITSSNVYYNITGYSDFYLNGITGSGDAVQINKNGNYRLIGTMSFSGGNGGDYETVLFVNGIESHECSFQRTTSSVAIGDATLTCIRYLNQSDQLVIKIKDLSSPPKNINIYALNFNIMEII